jgi:thiamine-monophosphate kinase
VSGSIGDAAFGLIVATKPTGLAKNEAAELLERYRMPRPRNELGQRLVGLAHAAIDVSDGLVADLNHICNTSGLGAVVDAASVPISAPVKSALGAGLGHGLDTVLSGGDDYELLFTAPASADRKIRAVGRKLGLAVTPIGRMIKGGGVRIERADGAELHTANRGYRHFGS